MDKQHSNPTIIPNDNRPNSIASSFFPAPSVLPIIDVIVTPTPSGNMKQNVLNCTTTACAATASVPTKLANIVNISKAHHSYDITYAVNNIRQDHSYAHDHLQSITLPLRAWLNI